MFAGMIFHREPFFHGSDNVDQMIKIVAVLGSDDFYKYVDRYKIKLLQDFQNLSYAKQPWSSFVENKEIANTQALDFLDHLLRYDHHERFTAAEAMAHCYFDSVRN